jgi:hypothetical protein
VLPNICELLPEKVTVPLLFTNVPLLVKSPDTPITPAGAVNDPLIVTLLNVVTLVPPITLVPLKLIVPVFGLNPTKDPDDPEALLVQFPFTLIEVAAGEEVIPVPLNAILL